MKKKKNQFNLPVRGGFSVSGVTMPKGVLPYYYLWYGGTSTLAPYGLPPGVSETAQNAFGKDADGASTSNGSAAAGGDASTAAGAGIM